MIVGVPEHFSQQMQQAYNGVMLGWSTIANGDVMGGLQEVRGNVAAVALIGDNAVEFVRLQGGDDEDLMAAETFALEWLQTVAEYVSNVILDYVNNPANQAVT